MAKDAYWFPHDSNARHDPRLVRLRMKHGLAGVGFWWCCVEFLRDQDGYEATREEFEALEFEMGETSGVFKMLISNGGLLEESEGMIFSQSLKNRMFEWDERKRKLSEAGKRGGRPVKPRLKGGLKVDKTTPKPAKSNNITGHNITEQNNTPKPPNGVDLAFGLFWKEYPKKIGKQAAAKAWKRNKPDLKKCLDTIAAQRKSDQWTKNGGQYIPNPATWINRGGWDDESTTTPPNNAGFDIV